MRGWGARGRREALAPPPAARKALPASAAALDRDPLGPLPHPNGLPQPPNQPALPATSPTNDSAPRRAAPLGACLEAGWLVSGGDISQSECRAGGWAGGWALCAPIGEAERRKAGVGLARGR